MAPRANRQPRRAEDTVPTRPRRAVDLVDRVNLPSLRDTPSSRRQYTYGSAAEPIAPRRFSGALANGQLNLDSAIQNALAQQAEDLDQARSGFSHPENPAPGPRTRRQAQTRAGRATQNPDDDDELASAAFPPPQRNDHVAANGGDDTRSFGVESDVFGDATIASTSDLSKNPILKSAKRTNNRRDVRLRASKSPVDSEPDWSDGDTSSGDELSVRRSLRHRRQSAKATDQQPKATSPQKSSNDVNASSRLVSQATRSQTTQSQAAQNQAPQNQAAQNQAAQSQAPQNHAAQSQASQNQATARQATARQAPQAQPNAPAQSPPRGLARQAQLRQAEAEQRRRVATEEAEAEERRRRDLEAARQQPRSDRSEQDTALQGDIQARENRLAEERERSLAHQQWQQRLDYVQSLSPSNFLRSRFRQVPVANMGGDEGGAPLRGLRDLWSKISVIVATIWRSIVQHTPRLDTIAAIVGAFILLTAMFPALLKHDPSGDLFETEKPPFARASGPLKSISESIGSVIPIITRPFRGGLSDKLAPSDFDLDGKFQLESFMKRHVEQFEHLKKAGLINAKSIKRLETILPKVVHMKLHRGKPVVAQEFWQALLELIQADNSILTIQKDGQLSKTQWKLVSTRLLNDAGLESRVSDSLNGAEARMEQNIAGLWDKWVKENDGKLQSMLGDSVEKLRALGTDEELNNRITRIVKEHSAAGPATDATVVTRDEFLRHLRNEFATHRSEIRAELNALQPHVQQLVAEAIEKNGLKQGEATKLSKAARAEISALVHQAVSEALVKLNLESVASGKILHHWEQLFRNNINYFSMGSGATINPKHSSATYDPYGKGVIDRRDLKKGLRGTRRWHHSEALMSWSEDGDMWCAARGVNLDGKFYGYMLGIQLGQPVIPQHIVIEHILPGATIDPNARPRDIEIYMQVEDPEMRERVLSFSATHISKPAGDEVVTPLNDDMILVARFAYVGAELHDGVYVHQLSNELLNLGAETSEIVIRAVNNYGEADHTCFYRVRMYGQTAESVREASASARENLSEKQVVEDMYRMLGKGDASR